MSAPKHTLDASYVCVGEVGKPHGVRGDFYLTGRSGVLNPDIQTLVLDPKLGDSQKTLHLTAKRFQKGRNIIRVKEWEHPDQILLHLNKKLWVLRADLKIDATHEYLWSDLLNIQVLAIDNQVVGRVVDVHNQGSCDIVTIAALANDRRRIEFPLIQDYVDMKVLPSVLQLKVNLDDFSDAWYEG